MAFSFNFDVQLQNEENTDDDMQHETLKSQNRPAEANDSSQKTLKEAIEHKNPRDVLSHIDNCVTETATIGSLPPLHYINEYVFEQTAPERDDSENIFSQTVNKKTDLITGVYEGGLKIWECTFDLLEYIDGEGETFSGKRVLDLGCGAGLLGILALKRRASQVHFQDYNSTVIEQLTMPNVFLNCEEESGGEGMIGDDKGKKDGSPPAKRRTMDSSHDSPSDQCRFFSGDWTSYLSLMESEDPTPKYDIIFTSETIYNTNYYPSLHSVFCKLLADDGVVYLATKSHYFGVGGGLYLFQEFVKEKGVFEIKSLKDINLGLKRHIVSLAFKKSHV